MLNDVLMKGLADVEFNTLDAMEFEITLVAAGISVWGTGYGSCKGKCETHA